MKSNPEAGRKRRVAAESNVRSWYCNNLEWNQCRPKDEHTANIRNIARTPQGEKGL